MVGGPNSGKIKQCLQIDSYISKGKYHSFLRKFIEILRAVEDKDGRIINQGYLDFLE